MAGVEFADWLGQSREGYVADLTAAGVDGDDAERRALEQQAMAFPDGRPAPGFVVAHVVVAGERVGSVWFGREGDTRTWWVWDIEIQPVHRGRGFGRAAMRLVEDEVRARGGTEIGLNVFGSNHRALSLYRSLGYEEAAIRMRKQLQ